MRKIGLVGGTGPESTLMYYKELNPSIPKVVCKEVKNKGDVWTVSLKWSG